MSKLIHLSLFGLLCLACEAKAPSSEPPRPSDAGQESGVIKANAALKTPKAKTPHPRARTGLKEALTIERYEAVLLGLAGCEVGLFGIERKCSEWKDFERIRRSSQALMKSAASELAVLGRKHIKHEAPAVRIQSASLMDNLFKVKSEEAQTLITEAAKVEQNPMVLKRFVRLLSSAIAKNEAIRALIIELADHPHDKVRTEVAKALTDSWARGTEGTLERAIKLVEVDPSPAVRVYTCKYLGTRADDRAIPTLERYLKSADTPPDLYAGCLRGLISMWSSPVPHAKPSKAAYQLTLEVLAKKPQPKDIWMVLSALEYAAKPIFRKRAKGWYKNEALVKLLKGFVLDKEFFWLGRSQAADVLAKLTGEAAQLEALKVQIQASASGDDNHVIRKLNEIIARMTAPRLTPGGSTPPR